MISVVKNFPIVLWLVIVVAAIAMPLAAWRHSRSALLEQDQQLQRQGLEIAAVAREQRRTSNSALPGALLDEEQLRELLRLRAEAAALRRQTNEPAPANAQPGFGSAGAGEAESGRSAEERAAALRSETLEAMKGLLPAVPEALERFAREHGGNKPRPDQFSQLRKYFPKVEGARMPGLYTFQFVREEGPKPGDSLILKEQSWRSHLGNAVKVYGFSNGEAIEVTFPDDGRAQQNFAAWESQHLPSTDQ